jgi:hypothetical protein
LAVIVSLVLAALTEMVVSPESRWSSVVGKTLDAFVDITFSFSRSLDS